MPQPPASPPLRVAVREFKTPVLTDGIYTERIDYTVAEYRPIERGTKYADQVGADQSVIDQFPDLRFLKESRNPIFYPWALRIWATDRLAEDTYNSAVEYVSEAVEFPAYTRVYMVRRDAYEASTTKEIGTPLDSLIAVKMLDEGLNYTYATFDIDPNPDDAAEIKPVIDKANGGKIIAAIVTKQGGPFTEAPTITINGDGGDAKCVGIIQPQSAVLVKQKKTELDDNDPLRDEYVLVTQVYETLPGPWVYSEKMDDDGVKVTVKTRRNIAANIVVADSLVSDLWSTTSKKGVDDFVAEETNESRTVRIDGTIGTHLTTERVDEDGVTVVVAREMASQAYIDTIDPREFLDGGFWVRITSEAIDDLRGWLVAETRAIPGNPISTAKVDGDAEVNNISTTLRDESAITPSSSESGGFITTVEKTEHNSALVANQVTTVRRWLDEAGYHVAIPEGIIPEEFRAEIPFVTETHTRAGTASMPTLASGEFEHSKKQKDKNLYIETIVSLGSVSLPQTQTGYLMTELNGGGILQVVRTLAGTTLAAEEGLLVIYSKAFPLGNGMWFRETRSLYAETAWPPTYGTHVDERYGIKIDITKQVVAAGTTGGLSGGVYTEIQARSKYRSLSISSALDPSSLPEDVQWFGGMIYSFPPELTDALIDWATATCGCSSTFSADLIANFKPYRGPVKTRVTEQFYEGPPPDDVTITQFFPQAHNFGFAWASFCGDTDGNCVTKSGAPHFYIPPCLHDDLTLTIGLITFSFPATTPAALPHGEYIMLPPHIERHPFNVFRRVLTEVLVP